MLTWCMTHPWMTFFLAFWAITCLYEIVFSIAKTVRIACACKYKSDGPDELEDHSNE